MALRTLLLSMLRRDHELRLSEAVQRRYAACGDDGEAKERVTASVQRQVAAEAGFAGRQGAREGVEVLQGALSLFPNDTELTEACFYLKNNIHVPCPIPTGTIVPLQLPLHELIPSLLPAEAGPRVATCSLADLVGRAPLTVLAAGSAT